ATGNVPLRLFVDERSISGERTPSSATDRAVTRSTTDDGALPSASADTKIRVAPASGAGSTPWIEIVFPCTVTSGPAPAPDTMQRGGRLPPPRLSAKPWTVHTAGAFLRSFDAGL